MPIAKGLGPVKVRVHCFTNTLNHGDIDISRRPGFSYTPQIQEDPQNRLKVPRPLAEGAAHDIRHSPNNNMHSNQGPPCRQRLNSGTIQTQSKALFEKLEQMEADSKKEIEILRSRANPPSKDTIHPICSFWHLGRVVLKPIHTLGVGASGVVFCAEDTALHWANGTEDDSEVAVKVFPRHRRELFDREVEFMWTMGPGGLSPSLFATAETDNHLVIVMVCTHYSPGNYLTSLESRATCDLHDVRAEMPSHKRCIREEECKRIIKELILLIDLIHDRGFVHFDLKPENILVNGYGRLILCDGSLAATLSEIKSDRFFMRGTPGYMYPEVANGEPLRYPYAPDMYAIGAILAWLRDVVNIHLPILCLFTDSF